jgi:LuxR family maltose regulon positive regulatory protein
MSQENPLTTTPLLKTKILIPPKRPNRVMRPRLVERLDEGLHCKLTLISAAPGYGKTTLLTEWLSGLDRPVAWLTLDEDDNDPNQCLRYLVATLQSVNEGIGRNVQQALSSSRRPKRERLLAQLIDDTSSLAPEDAVQESFTQFIENSLPSTHIVISTRVEPPIPLPRLRAMGQSSELHDQDLRFNTQETGEFFRRTMNLSLSPSAIQTIEIRTEGWITGMQLAALSLKEGVDSNKVESFIRSFSGEDRFVEEYLLTEVLDRQPKVMRDFLLLSSILGRLCASLCQAVTGRKNSQELLEQLEGGNVFIVALDNQREWFRYHHLFGEVLRNSLDEKTSRKVHRKALRWYESEHLFPQAIKHALLYSSITGDTGDAERNIKLAAEETLHSGGVVTVQGWLDALPDERVRRDTELATYKGWVIMLLTNDLLAAQDYARDAEASLKKKDVSGRKRGILLLLWAFIALGQQDYEEVIRNVTGSLNILDEDQPRWRVMALWALAEAQERTRRITDAIPTLREASRSGALQGDRMFTILIEASLASALNNNGQRVEAVTVCERAIEQFSGNLSLTPAVGGVIYSWLGRLYYEANRLDLAESYNEKGLALNEEIHASGPLTFSLGVKAAILNALGKMDQALVCLERAYGLAVQETLSDASWLPAWEMNLRLMRGDLYHARNWSKRSGLSLDDEPQYLRIEEQLTFGRLLIEEGELSKARRWLARLERFTLEREFFRWLITVYILQANTAVKSGDHNIARERLSRALEIAAPQDYVRAFLDENPIALSLLPGLRDTAPVFVDLIIESAGMATVRQDASQQPLTDHLTQREIEVLLLIAAGLSNQEIAEELVIAVGTVKRHINHIYAKLDVHSRIQATARARELRLIT